MKSVLVLIALLGAPQAFAQGYGSCYVERGVAHALFCSRGSDSDSGSGTISAYDRNGSETNRGTVTWVGVAVMGCDEVATVSVNSDAVGCSFNLGH